jgi:hypothetical protein
VNWRHLQAFLWLRWRLMANQARRAGPVNAVLVTILSIAALVVTVPLFIGSFLAGVYAFDEAAPAHLMYAWDGVVVAFVFFWAIGLMTELQRTESLSLSKFLHLPVSVKGAFLINYVSSLVRLSLIVFVPVFVGLAGGLVVARGARLLPVWPLSAAFFLMFTALTYQFQGWLAALMSNPRRRRTVVVATTALFILVVQLPNLLSIYGPWTSKQGNDRQAELVARLGELDRALKAQEISAEEHIRRQNEIVNEDKLAADQATSQTVASAQRIAALVNLVLPLGWLPLGVKAAAEGNFAPALLGTLGMSLIGAASLWRAYRTTLRMYQGQFAGKIRSVPVAAPPASGRKPGVDLLERRLWRLSEPVSAVALSGFRSLLRAPETKMMLLTPVFFGAVFGATVLSRPDTVPVPFRPLAAIGAIGFMLLGMLQLMANQFGFDRDGFRVFVLCAASRRDILLGKNLSFAPLALGMAALLLTIAQVVCPLRWDHFLAMLPQSVSMYLLFCALTNLVSIYTPMYIAAGSMKPSNMKLVPGLVQFFLFTVLFPLTQSPTLLPLGIEAALTGLGWGAEIPICLLLTLVECAAVIGIYRAVLSWEGKWFQSREQKILEVVTSRAL